MKPIFLPRIIGGLVLGLFIATAASGQEALDNVVIVLDSSGSMSGTLPGSGMEKLTAAKAALKQVLQTVPSSTQVGLLVFSAKGVDDDWIYPLGPRDDARLMQAIERPQPGYGTPLGNYLKKGADRLLEARAKQFGYGTFRLLVVTDGEADDPKSVDRHTPEIIARGITVDVIGVAMKKSHTLATRVHSYRSANDPASLKQAIAAVFGEIGGGGGKDVAGAEAFAELAPIPGEVAQAMIQALASSGNQPIGERPRRATESPAAGGAPATQAAAQPTPVTTQSPAGAAPILSILGGLVCFGSVGLALLILIIRAARNSRR